MNEDNFASARLESKRASNYEHKTSKNNIAKEFIDLYVNSNDDSKESLKDVANTYLLLEEGIVPSSYSGKILELSQKDIDDIYVKIKQNASNNFILFYNSYIRKIEQGFYPEYVDSALQDAKIAYQTLRKSSNSQWNCPIEMITTSEMENLYLLISGQKKEGNKMTEILK